MNSGGVKMITRSILSIPILSTIMPIPSKHAHYMVMLKTQLWNLAENPGSNSFLILSLKILLLTLNKF
jgi:hypothetical protein